MKPGEPLPPQPFVGPGTTTAIVAAGGLLLSVLAAVQVSSAERARAEAEFVRRSEVRHALTSEIISNYESGLYGLRNLFVGSNEVTRSEFREAANDMLARFEGVTALQWAPVVPHERRQAFEEATARELGRPYRIFERSPGAVQPAAAVRERYAPILFCEPLEGNEQTFGLDLLNFGAEGGPRARQRALEENRMIASPVANLLQGRQGTVMVWPIFRKPSPDAAPVFSGFFQAVFRFGDIFEQTRRRLPNGDVDALYVDATANSPARQTLYFLPDNPAEDAAIPSETDFRSGLTHSRTISVGGREWLAIYRPSPGWLAAQSTQRPLYTLSGGLLITGLLCSLVFTLGRRNSAINALVERRTTELSESRRQIDNLLHALPGIAFRCRPEDGRLKLVFVSEGAFALTGYAPEEFISGRIHIRDCIHPEDLPQVRAVTRAAIEKRTDFEVEYRLRVADGQDRWVLSRGRGTYDAQGKLLLLEGLAVDLTEGKRAEADKLALERTLLERQKLESLGVLAGGIAHDFNNLLTTIMGNASLARLELEPASPLHRGLHQIEISSVRAAELCQQMLAYSGKSRCVVERIDLTALIEDTLPLLQFSVSAGAILQTELARDLPPVLADATQIRQIVMNLVINASEALCERPGHIRLRTSLVEIDAAALREMATGAQLPAGRYVQLQVMDDGCGMSLETARRIFEPFFTTKFAGRGLGLAAVLGIVRSHKGALGVKSEPGKGTTFTLLLAPTDGAASRNPDRPPQLSPWHHSGIALVIDDEADVRTVAAQILEKIGFTVVTATGGAEGVALFEQDPGRFTLVLIDMTMPDLPGDRVLHRIRALNERIPVILMSGKPRPAELASERHTDFLPKPFAVSDLVAKVRAAVAE